MKDGVANHANGREVLVLYDLLGGLVPDHSERRLAEKLQIHGMMSIQLVFKSPQVEGFSAISRRSSEAIFRVFRGSKFVNDSLEFKSEMWLRRAGIYGGLDETS